MIKATVPGLTTLLYFVYLSLKPDSLSFTSMYTQMLLMHDIHSYTYTFLKITLSKRKVNLDICIQDWNAIIDIHNYTQKLRTSMNQDCKNNQ